MSFKINYKTPSAFILLMLLLVPSLLPQALACQMTEPMIMDHAMMSMDDSTMMSADCCDHQCDCPDGSCSAIALSDLSVFNPLPLKFSIITPLPARLLISTPNLPFRPPTFA